MGRRRKLTGRESSLFDFTDVREKMWCPFCRVEGAVEETRGTLSLLECGHVVVRESNSRLKALHEWNERYGFPKRPRGWYQPPKGTWEVYPTVREMNVRISLEPAVLREIRERMGPDWKANDY